MKRRKNGTALILLFAALLLLVGLTSCAPDPPTDADALRGQWAVYFDDPDTPEKEEEFDAQQVKAILNLLDALDPLPERTEADLRKAARARDGREPGRIGADTIGGEGRRDIPLSWPPEAESRIPPDRK